MLNSNDQDRLELSLAAAARRDAELQAAAAAERQQSRQRRRQQRRQLVAWLHGRRRYVRGMVVGAALAMLAVTLLPLELMNQIGRAHV